MKRACFYKNTNKHENPYMRVPPKFIGDNLKTNFFRMKKRINKPTAILIVFLVIILHVSCKKENEFNPLTGQLLGFVVLNGTTTDNSGVTVTIEGSDPEIVSKTDERGMFFVDGLKSGTYNIIFYKEGYNKYKEIGYQFVGGGKPSSLGTITLLSPPLFEVLNPSITDYSNESYVMLLITGKLFSSNEIKYAAVRYYLSNDPGVSYKNYIENKTIENIGIDLNYYILINTLKFPSGSDLYLKIYPSLDYDQYYFDIEIEKKIYTDINYDKASETVKIIVPNLKPHK